jgi:hypothetical protein
MDHVFRWQPVACGDLRSSGGAATEHPAFLEHCRPCGAVDRAVDSGVAEQRHVGGIDDRIHA